MPVHLMPRAAAYSNHAPQPGPTSRMWSPGFSFSFSIGVVELARRRRLERLVVALVDALRVGGRLGVEESEEEIGIDVVMRADRLLVGVHLAEEQRLEEAPRLGQEMEIAHRTAQLEGLEHVAVEVDVARQIRVRDAAFVEARDRAQAVLAVDGHAEGRRAAPEALDRAVRHHDLERRGDVGVFRREAAEQGVRLRRFRRHSRGAIALRVQDISHHVSSSRGGAGPGRSGSFAL